MLELAAQERRERRLARHRRARAGHEQPDRRPVGVVGRVERRHDANARLRGRGREQGQDDEGHAHRAILAVCEDRGMTVTDALPVYHHREHHSIWIDAPPEAALAAARETRPEDVPLVVDALPAPRAAVGSATRRSGRRCRRAASGSTIRRR